MLEVSYTDTAVYLLITLWFTLCEQGFVAFFLMLLCLCYFSIIKLPFIIITRVNFFYCQSTYSQRATFYEYVATRFLKFSFKHFNPRTIGGMFMSHNVARTFSTYRRYSQGHTKIADVNLNYSEENGVKGLLVSSNCRFNKYDVDLMILYIHGGGFIQGSPWFYSEMLSVMLVSLNQQGFKNPAIFAVDYRTDDFGKDLWNLSECWSYLTVKYPKAHLVINGDGSGGLLSLALLFHIGSPYLPIPKPDPPLPRPSALILSSPWTKLFYMQTEREETEDYMNSGIMNKMSRDYLGEEQFNLIRSQVKAISLGLMHVANSKIDHYQNPIFCAPAFWEKAIPKYGCIVMYGDEEYLKEEIDELMEVLSAYGKVKGEPMAGQDHDWPVVTFYTERCEELREDGIQYITGSLSRMLLWNTESFFNRDGIVPIDIEYN